MWLGDHHPYVDLDAWVIMPNHVHGIMVILDDDTVSCDRRGGSRTALTTAPTTAPTTAKRKPLGRLIGAFKTVSTKRINEIRHTPGNRFWQRDYWEHIIRDESSLAQIRQYVINNPARWVDDRLHPTQSPLPQRS
jgi:REP element-mobilizing transposase RayT